MEKGAPPVGETHPVPIVARSCFTTSYCNSPMREREKLQNGKKGVFENCLWGLVRFGLGGGSRSRGRSVEI